MALFSDIDWLIIVAVGAFLLFGRGNGEAMRTLGRWYSRAAGLKRELLGEIAKAADLPLPSGGQPTSFRAALLGLAADPAVGRGVPVAVRTPPTAPAPPSPLDPSSPWAGGYLVTGWSTSLPSLRPAEENLP